MKTWISGNKTERAEEGKNEHSGPPPTTPVIKRPSRHRDDVGSKNKHSRLVVTSLLVLGFGVISMSSSKSRLIFVDVSCWTPIFSVNDGHKIDEEAKKRNKKYHEE